jgi:hypothetical protein
MPTGPEREKDSRRTSWDYSSLLYFRTGTHGICSLVASTTRQCRSAQGLPIDPGLVLTPGEVKRDVGRWFLLRDALTRWQIPRGTLGPLQPLWESG